MWLSNSNNTLIHLLRNDSDDLEPISNLNDKSEPTLMATSGRFISTRMSTKVFAIVKLMLLGSGWLLVAAYFVFPNWSSQPSTATQVTNSESKPQSLVASSIPASKSQPYSNNLINTENDPLSSTINIKESLVLQAKGYVIAQRIATVSAVATARLVELLVEPGSVIEQGQLLARLDSNKESLGINYLESELAVLEAKLHEQSIQSANLKKIYDRKKRLNIKDLISIEAIEQAETDYIASDVKQSVLGAQINSQKVLINQKKQEILDYEVRAPFSGYVINTNAQIGEIISPSSAGGGFTRTGLCTLVDQDSIMGELFVSEELISLVQIGQAVNVTFDAYSGYEERAIVSTIFPSIDKERATVKVLVKFIDLDKKIKIGMRIGASFMNSEAINDGSEAS